MARSALEDRIAAAVAATPPWPSPPGACASRPASVRWSRWGSSPSRPSSATSTGAPSPRGGRAPIADDTGYRRGRRAIGGGRPIPRSLLYIAALHASRREPGFAAFRARMQAKGLTVKQALVATARKLLTVLNAMLKSGTDFIPKVAA